jgi:transcriptional regulator with XRE-family HTH domain
MKVKDQIRIRREALGMTMKELGDRVGITEQAVRHWESGRSWPGKTKLRLVERALSFTIDFSEGVARTPRSAMSMVDPVDHEMLVVIARMPKHAKEVFSEMARIYVEAVDAARGADPVPSAPAVKAVAKRAAKAH